MMLNFAAKRFGNSVAVLATLLLWSGPGTAEELRVGLAHEERVQIRCDGPFRAVLDGLRTEAVELGPGLYTIRIVDSPSFYRAAPLAAGLVASIPSTINSVVAISAPGSGDWMVTLLRTTSQSTAERATRDARGRFGGSVVRSREGAYEVLELGPFPNEYLAREAHEKARRYGFPARISQPRQGYVSPGSASPDVAQPRRIRRLDGRTTEVEKRRPAPRDERLELEALPPLSLDELKIAPLPTLPPNTFIAEPEPPKKEPIPQTQRADLSPDLGWVPAPEGKPKTLGKPKRIRSGAPERGVAQQRRRLPPPPDRLSNPRSRRGSRTPAPRPETSRRRPERPRFAPPPIEERPSGVAPRRLERRRIESIPPPPDVADSQFDRFDTDPVPLATARPRIRKKPYVFMSPDSRSSGPRFLRSIPILRRFWWQDPLVRPPEDEVAVLGDDLERALGAPDDFAEDGLENALRSPDEDFSFEEQMDEGSLLTGVPPTPRPFDPEMYKPGTIVESPRDREVGDYAPPRVQEYPDPKRVDLISEPEGDPEMDILEGMVPPSPGMADAEESAPLLFGDDSKDISPPEAAGPPSRGRAVQIPPTRPQPRASVQLFDDNGKAMTNPAAVIDLVSAGSSRMEFDGNSYHGVFQAYAPSKEWLVLTNRVELEDYLAGFLPQEIPSDAPVEVLKAQAVLSRGYTLQLASRGDYAEYGYDIPGDAASDYPYTGRTLETQTIRRAVRETASEVLVDRDGNVAEVVYCFSCGGFLASGHSIWGEESPAYLTSHPDFNPAEVGFDVGPEGFAGKRESLLKDWLQTAPATYGRDAAGEHFRWKRTLSEEQMDRLVNDHWNNQVGEVHSIEITERAPSGHATRMVIKGENQSVEARDSDTIREALQLDSTLIVIDEGWGSWTIYGGGFGHGVGFCQCGAIGLIKQRNASYRQVLQFYFKNLLLGTRKIARSSSGV